MQQHESGKGMGKGRNYAGCLIFVTDEQFSKICSDTSYSIPTNRIQSIRLVKIGNFSYQACGGTHIRVTSELQDLEIIKIKAKCISLKVYYSIKE